MLKKVRRIRPPQIVIVEAPVLLNIVYTLLELVEEPVVRNIVDDLRMAVFSK